MIIFDTSVWIEYFKNSNNAEIIEDFMNKEKIFTPSIVLIELSCKAHKEKWNFENHLKFIKSKSSIIGLTEKTIINVGINYIEQRKIKFKFGLADAIILTTAKEIGAKVLTKDSDFRNIKDCIILNN